MGISLFTGLAAGLVPAWSLFSNDLIRGLKQGLSRTDAAAGGRRTRSALVVAEVALSLVLLLGAALTIKSLGALRSIDPGLDPHGVLTLSLAVPQAKYPQPREQSAFFDRVLERVRVLPGVEAAGTVSALPLVDGGSIQPIAIAGRPAGAMAEQPEVAVRLITPGYLRTLRIPLRRGRDFTAADRLDQPAAVLISESMARRFWPGEDPIGKRLTLSFFPQTSRQVVGVVADVKVRGVRIAEAVQTLYVPLAQLPMGAESLVVRTKTPPESLVPAVTRAIHEVDPDLPVEDVATLDSVLADSLSQEHFNMLLLSAFAGLALLLAAVGIYSVLSYTVRRRVQEIGVRMALGAQVRDVLGMVVVEGLRPTLLGILLGSAAAFALGRALASLFYGVSATDPALFVSVALLLAFVALLASAGPAWRATRVPPSEALRE